MDMLLKWASRVGPFVSLPLLVWLSIGWRQCLWSQGCISTFKVFAVFLWIPSFEEKWFFSCFGKLENVSPESYWGLICSGLKPLCTNNTSSVVNKECDILRANRFTKFFPLNFDSENPQVELHFQKLATAGYFINGNSAQLFRWNWRIAPQIICRQVVV